MYITYIHNIYTQILDRYIGRERERQRERERERDRESESESEGKGKVGR